MSDQQPHKYFFCHIPKTGGITLHNVLQQRFGAEETLRISAEQRFSWRANKLIDEINNENYTYISSHLPIDTTRYITAPTSTIVMLRHPLSRVISAYNYNVEKGAIKHINSFVEFVQQTNIQMLGMYILGTLKLDSLDKPFTMTLNDANFERFQQILDGVEFVGISEDFRRSIDLLTYTFNWSHHISIPRRNSTTDHSITLQDLSPTMVDYLLENLQAEIQYYEYAVEVFNARYNQMMQQLTLNHFQRSNALDSKASHHVDFSQYIRGCGWSAVSKEDDVSFRWIVEDHALLEVPPMIGATARIQFLVVKWVAQDILDAMVLYINDTEVSLHYEAIEQNTSHYLFIGKADLPLQKQNNQPLQIIFSVNRLVKYANQHLSVAISWVKVDATD